MYFTLNYQNCKDNIKRMYKLGEYHKKMYPFFIRIRNYLDISTGTYVAKAHYRQVKQTLREPAKKHQNNRVISAGCNDTKMCPTVCFCSS